MNIQKTTRRVVLAGMVAAMYVALVLLNISLSFYGFQFRAAEVLTVLPFLFPETVLGLFVGCFIANLGSPFGLPDVIFGSLATLAAACLTHRCKSRWLAPIPPILINAVVVGAMIALFDPSLGGGSWAVFIAMALNVGAGQLVVCAGMGIPLLFALEKMKLREKLQL